MIAPWVQVALAVLGVVGAGGGVTGLLMVRANRGRIMAESQQISANADESVASAVKVLIGGASDLVEPLKRELREARGEVAEARGEVAELRVAVAQLTGEMRMASRVYAAVWDPEMTLERLRMLVPRPGPARA